MELGIIFKELVLIIVLLLILFQIILDVPEDDGVRYVKIGNYPYPLFCPIIEKKVRK